MKQRVYIDTSVVGGYFDKEFSKETIPFFESVKNGELIIIVSDILEAELFRAPGFIKELITYIPTEFKESVRLSAEATQLADKYIEAKVVGKTSRADCQHIAIATLANADVLVSWNFKHIVNLDRIRGYNGINYQNGHKMIEIRTPKEIIKYGNDD
ncbi:PIN domain protein [Pedobacter sp. SD-b]|uniref:PIN domain protein n=1 Tax=Pedobacter segetis TaxID=2793069 RepID=A0ABS1BH92_9SPHI|nr:PIN domain protein [Pedobacter segetis]MBK0382225.1 PIN domain protein [Pedobacter segetis]